MNQEKARRPKLLLFQPYFGNKHPICWFCNLERRKDFHQGIVILAELVSIKTMKKINERYLQLRSNGQKAQNLQKVQRESNHLRR